MVFIFSAVFVLSGCGKEDKVESDNDIASSKEETAAENLSAQLNVCKEEKVAIEGYGDKGKRLKNCFVGYPGEPSRQDKSYYILEDICGQFTKEFVENALDKKVMKVELPQIASLNNCTYYFNEKEYVMLNLEYLSIENQKKGNEFAGYKVEKSDKIPMNNLVVWQKDNLINVVYLVLSPNKFISLRPLSQKSFTSPEEFLNFAAKLGAAIKNYK